MRVECGNAIEPQRTSPVGQELGWNVEGGGHAELPQDGSGRRGIALFAIVKREKAEGSPSRISQTGQEFVVRDEIEMATEEIDVRARFTPGERVVVEDDSTAAPTGEAKEHLGKRSRDRFSADARKMAHG